LPAKPPHRLRSIRNTQKRATQRQSSDIQPAESSAIDAHLRRFFRDGAVMKHRRQPCYRRQKNCVDSHPPIIRLANVCPCETVASGIRVRQACAAEASLHHPGGEV
jgi:hypothetical protein